MTDINHHEMHHEACMSIYNPKFELWLTRFGEWDSEQAGPITPHISRLMADCIDYVPEQIEMLTGGIDRKILYAVLPDMDVLELVPITRNIITNEVVSGDFIGAEELEPWLRQVYNRLMKSR